MAKQVDTANLRKALMRVKRELESERFPVEDSWRDIRKNCEPVLGKALVRRDSSTWTPAKDLCEIWDGEVRNLIPRTASGLLAGITSPSREWFRFGLGRGERVAVSETEWLEMARKAVAEELHGGNFYQTAYKIYMHLITFGTSCAVCYANAEGPGRPGGGLFFRLFDEGAYWVRENPQSERVETCLTAQEMSGREIRKEFGEKALGDWLSQDAASKLSAKRTVYNLIIRRGELEEENDEGVVDLSGEIAEGREFASVWFVDAEEIGRDGVLAVRSFPVCPVICPRWSPDAGAYGAGPATFALADIKTLHESERALANLAREIEDPAYQAPDLMEGRIRRLPGSLTYIPGSVFSALSGSQKALSTVRDVDSRALEMLMRRVGEKKQMIGRFFFSDLLAMLLNLSARNKNMTATEVNELANEKVTLLGAILTKLDYEMLAVALNVSWELVLESAEERHPELLKHVPARLHGKDIVFEYISVFHQAQKEMMSVAGVTKVVGHIGSMAQLRPDALDLLDVDKAARSIADAVGESGLLLDEDAVAEVREARAAAQQAEQKKSDMERAARVAKDMAGAPAFAGSSLPRHASAEQNLTGGGYGY